MSRKKRNTATTAPTNLTAFRCAERLLKDRSRPVDLSLAFDPQQVIWDAKPVEGRTRGVWRAGDGAEEVCWKVGMGGLAEAGMGQTRWKGKAREEEQNYAIVIPRIPGLVLFPRILPETLQRDLVVETLQHARQPNLTQLDKLYELPPEGLWNAWVAGKGNEVVKRGAAVPADAEPEHSVSPLAVDEAAAGSSGGSDDASSERVVTVGELLPKLRWANVGWYYDWTTKRYQFDRGFVPLPPLILRCCRALGRKTPWSHVFGAGVDLNAESVARKPPQEWRRWEEGYEPDAGIVNFYQLRDSLTSHVDQAEVDAVSPLVSLSLGHSCIFLIGGSHRNVPPLAILLRSGDGLCMSGEGRRAYHGLPRVLEGTLPDYLSASQAQGEDWRPYGEYLEKGARININVRSVF